LAPQDRVIEVCADKQATIDALAAHGIPVPAGRTLEPGIPIPSGFRMPAVRKARAGCGCEGLCFVSSSEIAASAMATRLEAFMEGTPVGVSLLAGPRGLVALPPMQQRFLAGDSPRYVGSDLLADDVAAARATALAIRSACALDADCGWIGVDLVLGERSDGRDDRVLEVNPRMTTSIVGQTALFASSLVAAMIEAAEGRSPCLERAFPSGPRSGSFSLPVA
jgi:predicted ATP-grasp superfamily ATP-dependent carboligase